MKICGRSKLVKKDMYFKGTLVFQKEVFPFNFLVYYP